MKFNVTVLYLNTNIFQMNQSDQKDPLAAMRFRAMDLLARREHSRVELQRKLRDKFPEHVELIDTVIAGLMRDQLQSDERFAEAFVSFRTKKGQGPHRISLELQQRGVSDSIIDAVLSINDITWYQLARDVLDKKYGGKPCSDFKEQAKRRQFLHYRGFNSDQISACFNSTDFSDD